MTNPQEEFDEDGNLIVQETTDTIDYKALLEKEKAEREKRENRFKSTAKELNETKAKFKTPEEEDEEASINGANEYLKSHGVNLLKEQGFISKDDLANELQKQLQQQKDIEKLDKFPQLVSQKDAILQLSKVDGLSIEETIKKYKFVDEEGMENFHKPTIGSRKTPGSINMENPTAEDLEMIKKMSPDEFNKFMGL